MAHRHVHGNVLFEYFVGRVNSDQTEGKGVLVDHVRSSDHLTAYQHIQREGVMGVGDGDVVKRTYIACENVDCKIVFQISEIIYYGSDFVKNQAGKRGYENIAHDGWHRNYSPLLNDPEYDTYLRLKKRFEDA